LLNAVIGTKRKSVGFDEYVGAVIRECRPGALKGFVGGDAQLDSNLPTGTTGSLEDYLSI